MVSRVMRRRRMYRQNGAGFFDIIKKAGKFLGSKKARKLLEFGRRGLDFADKAQRGIASFTGQSGAGNMRGGRGMSRHPITASQARQLMALLGTSDAPRRRRRGRGTVTGRRRRRTGRRGRNQKGGFFGWILKKLIQ